MASLLGVVKWALVPAALAATGYWYLGPRLGGELPKKIARRLQGTGLVRPGDAKEPAPVPAGETTRPANRGPAIEVKVREDAQVREAPKAQEPPRRRRKRRRPRPTEERRTEAPAPRAEAPSGDGADPAGSGTTGPNGVP